MPKIRTGTIDEVIRLTQLLPEFDQPYRKEIYEERLQGVAHLILVAQIKEEVVACKLGYERTQDGSFYSWIGGVLPGFRRRGLARKLAEAQEEWARAQAYEYIRFKTRNRHSEMLLFALRRGFYLIDFEPYEDIAESRIWLEKKLVQFE